MELQILAMDMRHAGDVQRLTEQLGYRLLVDDTKNNRRILDAGEHIQIPPFQGFGQPLRSVFIRLRLYVDVDRPFRAERKDRNSGMEIKIAWVA